MENTTTTPKVSLDPAAPHDRDVLSSGRMNGTRSGALSRSTRPRPGQKRDTAAQPWLGHSDQQTPRRCSPTTQIQGSKVSTAASRRRSPWGPMTLAAGFAVFGLVLLVHAPTIAPKTDGAASADPWPGPTSPRPSSAHGTVSPSSVADGIPVPGDGPAGDVAVQRLLDRSSPPDVPRSLETRLVQLGMQVWKADVTGRGRERWPTYFGPGGPAAAGPRSVYRDVRIQAGIARRAGSGQVDVRLVWAATDPSGGRRDGRLAHVSFRPVPGHPNRWEPVA